MTGFLRSVDLHDYAASVKGMGYKTTQDLLRAGQAELASLKSHTTGPLSFDGFFVLAVLLSLLTNIIVYDFYDFTRFTQDHEEARGKEAGRRPHLSKTHPATLMQPSPRWRIVCTRTIDQNKLDGGGAGVILRIGTFHVARN